MTSAVILWASAIGSVSIRGSYPTDGSQSLPLKGFDPNQIANSVQDCERASVPSRNTLLIWDWPAPIGSNEHRPIVFFHQNTL